MILVTGATGTVGGEVALRLAPDRPVRLLARQPERVTAAGPSVEVVQGDYDDGASLRRALRGVRAAFLVTNRMTEADDVRFLEAARAEGVRHLVKLSAAAVQDEDAQDLITKWQRRNEELLQSSGLAWTILRPRSYMSNALSWRTSIRRERVVRAVYGSSLNACVDPRDVAEVAVRALTRPGHEAKAYTLTGPRAISAIEQTAVLAEALASPLRFEEIDVDEARAQLLGRYPQPIAEALLESSARQRDGAKAQVENTVLEVTGRRPRSFLTWAVDHSQAFAQGRAPAGPSR